MNIKNIKRVIQLVKNKKYVPRKLTDEEKAKQIKSIIEKRNRPKLSPMKTRKSKWTIMADKYFKNKSIDGIAEQLSNEFNLEKTELKKGLTEIYDKGMKAYYTSGSRPNVSPEQWGHARLYSVLFNGTSRKIDKNIVEKYKIPNLNSNLNSNLKLKENNGKGATATKILLKKEEYSPHTEKIMKLISIGDDYEVMGSYGYKSMKYASDIDLFERVHLNSNSNSNSNSISSFINDFKNIVKNVRGIDAVITDIKLGQIKGLKIIDETAYIHNGKVYGYDYKASLRKAEDLYKKQLISKKELERSKKLLKDNPSVEDLLKINKELRWHILRWKPSDILNGFLKYRGFKIPIEKAVKSGGMIKMDFVFNINDQYQEVSNIYDLRENKIRLYKEPLRFIQSVMNDIELFKYQKKYFKSLKRIFTLVNFKNRQNPTEKTQNLIKEIFNILNTDLGIIYQTAGYIESLIDVLNDNENDDNIKNDIKNRLDDFIIRLNNVYTSNEYLKDEKTIFKDIKSAMYMKNPASKLEKIKDKLMDILNNSVEDEFREIYEKFNQL